MKLKINYDLLDKIRQSKNGAKLYKSEVKAMLNEPVFKFVNFNLLAAYVAGFILDKKIGIILTILGCAGICGGSALITNKVLKNFSKIREEEAVTELQELANRLYNLEVRTTGELLKESKLNDIKHKIVYSDGALKIPKLKQTKEIIVPLTNGYEETILQEHIFGDKDYEISVGELGRKRKTKLIKAKMGV